MHRLQHPLTFRANALAAQSIRDFVRLVKQPITLANRPKRAAAWSVHPIEQRELVQVVYPFEYDCEHEKLGNLLPDAFRLNGQQRHGVAETMAAQQI